MDRDLLRCAVERNVFHALREDIAQGDVSAELIPQESQSVANLMTRSAGIICGRPWIDEVARQVDGFAIEWLVDEGSSVQPDEPIARLRGNSRALLSAERVMINFLQTLSGTATTTRSYCHRIGHTNAKILDTRKTIPGLRVAQKYAVSVGGGENHRMGLFDAFLIKENHITAAGSITAAVHSARTKHASLALEVEVESIQQLAECVTLKVPRVLLDNFTLIEMRIAVERFAGLIELEASGGITLDNISAVAETGVDYISVGAITKDVQSLDLSLRFN